MHGLSGTSQDRSIQPKHVFKDIGQEEHVTKGQYIGSGKTSTVEWSVASCWQFQWREVKEHHVIQDNLCQIMSDEHLQLLSSVNSWYMISTVKQGH